MTYYRLIVTSSWDDGCFLDLKLAELLKKYNIKGTFYISKCYFDKSLTEYEMKTIDQYHEIGAHSINHIELTKVSPNEAEREIKHSKYWLEKILTHSIQMFCYPYGKYNDKIKKLVKEAGFIGARTCKFNSFSSPKDPHEFGITLLASNGSPFSCFKTWLRTSISINSLRDWSIQAKLLFDLAMKNGGVWHLYGHSWEIEKNNDWNKLEKVLKYVSNREDIGYLTNADVLKTYFKK